MLLNLEDRVREPARGKEPAALGSNAELTGAGPAQEIVNGAEPYSCTTLGRTMDGPASACSAGLDGGTAARCELRGLTTLLMIPTGRTARYSPASPAHRLPTE
jgi:hypothetical protein